MKGEYQYQQHNSEKIKNIGSGSKKLAVSQQNKNRQHTTNGKVIQLFAVIGFEGKKSVQDGLISVGCSKIPIVTSAM
jgi:hypothetical protein